MKREKRIREVMPVKVSLPVALQKAIANKAGREKRTVGALVRSALQKEFGLKRRKRRRALPPPERSK